MQNLYRIVLNPDQFGHSFCPLTLIHTRFFRAQASFYDFEIINKSRVKAYTVLLETALYQKAIRHLESVQ